MSDTYETPRRHVALVADALALDPATTDRLKWKLEADLRCDETGELSFANGATSTAEWLRMLEKSDPSLLGKSDPMKPATAPVLSGAQNLTDLMVRARGGDADAMKTLSSPPTSTSRPGDTRSITALMIAAKQGDASARLILDQILKA